MKTNKSKTTGFSLIEVLVFITVFSLFFIIAASVVTTTLRITKQNQNKIKATHYAEELKEWLQAEKEINWGGTAFSTQVTSFTEHTTISPTLTDFCFNDNPISDWPNTGTSACYMMLDNQFRRIATFSASSVDNGYIKQINGDISVEWMDGKILHKVPLKVVFSVWE